MPEKILYSYQRWPLVIEFGEVVVDHPEDYLPARISYRESSKESAHLLVDFLAYVEHSPLFLETGDHDLDQKLCGIYETTSEEGFYVRGEINDNEHWEIVKIGGGIPLALYNTGLKQPEHLAALARIEYGVY